MDTYISQESLGCPEIVTANPDNIEALRQEYPLKKRLN